MVIWGFNEHSVLNKTWVRVLNAVVLVPFLLLIMCMEVITINITPIAIIYIPLSVGISIAWTLGRMKWFEIEKEESQKKESFIICYCCIAALYALAIITFVTNAIKSYYNTESLCINIALIVYFVFNKINLCSLLNFGNFFTNKLSLYSESPCELSHEEILKREKDMMKFILRKEHNIDVDELYSELSIYKD